MGFNGGGSNVFMLKASKTNPLKSQILFVLFPILKFAELPPLNYIMTWTFVNAVVSKAFFFLLFLKSPSQKQFCVLLPPGSSPSSAPGPMSSRSTPAPRGTGSPPANTPSPCPSSTMPTVTSTESSAWVAPRWEGGGKGAKETIRAFYTKTHQVLPIYLTSRAGMWTMYIL